MSSSSGVSSQQLSLETLLLERFRITTGFHPGQREIIEQLVQGKHVLAIQRTGWGKSLCYQMASLHYPHLTIVFSPLKALMRDQCQRCNNAYAIPAAIVSSDFTLEENKATLEQAVMGNFKILFIAPERLSNDLWQSYVQKMRVSMIVVDEAHCISTWGHDFRPDYRRIVHLVNALPKNMPILALTATANKRVEEDILQQIGDAQVHRGTMKRPNLYLNVVQVNGDAEKLSYLAEVLPSSPGTGIIYTATRGDAEMVATFLQQQGIAAQYYHAGTENEVRQEVEQGLMANQYKVICSTNALGMGIDKPDLRYVIHYHIPASPIHYYQEMGRAGRDGLVAYCILLYDPTDLEIQRYFIHKAKLDGSQYEMVLTLIRASNHGLGESDLMLATGLAQKPLRTMLADLEEQHLIERNARTRIYQSSRRFRRIDFSAYDIVRSQKEQELGQIEDYAQTKDCYMDYLTSYLGDIPGYHCGACANCEANHFPLIRPAERIQEVATQFLAEDYLPHIEKHGTVNHPQHEAGWALAYHSKSTIGKLVRASKYEEAGPFARQLVNRTVEVIQARYPIGVMNGIVSVPPTKSGLLVETFARQVAEQLGIEYLPVIAKVRLTQEQKELTNWRQKSSNVKGAFIVRQPELIAGRTLLLIDDIYDSGWMLREIGQTLMQAGARAVYPFAITRTVHSDDQ
jgi:ATP-dependent DNA helicase RecQ